MPELPEVEVVRQSLNKIISQQKVKKVIVRNRNLRHKIPSNFEKLLKDQIITKVDRFSKKLIKLYGILNLKFLFLTITFFTFFCLIFLSSDCLTTSTSGNSGI